MIRDKEIQFFIIMAAGLFLLLIFFIVVFIISYYKRQLSFFKEKQALLSRYQEELLKTQLEIQEQTLKTISQEIHDNIGQVLSLAKLNLNTIDLTKQEALKEKIIDSKTLVSKAIQDLRDLAKTMNTDNIEAIGLLRALEHELEMIRKAGITATLSVEGRTIRLEPQKELIVFRIVQETVNNIIKHAEANAIDISVIYGDGEIELTVKDDGKGFDLTRLNEDNNTGFGLGIRNMHNRAKLIGADFSMNSTIGKGTVVSIIVPSNNHNL